MKKILSALLIFIAVSGCQFVQNPITNKNNSKGISDSKYENNSPELLSKMPINLSFSIKGTANASRVKSVDAYLVRDITDPLGSNVYNNSYKIQKNIVDGVINLSFTNYPITDQPYFVAIQAFDDVVEEAGRVNITVADNNILSTDKQFSHSSNSVISRFNSLTYSDHSVELKVIINLIEFNNLPVDIKPVDGSINPVNNIGIGTNNEN